MNTLKSWLARLGFLLHSFKGDTIKKEMGEALDAIKKIGEDASQARVHATAAMVALGEEISKNDAIIAQANKILN